MRKEKTQGTICNTLYKFSSNISIELTAGNIIKEEKSLNTRAENIVYAHSNTINSNLAKFIFDKNKLFTFECLGNKSNNCDPHSPVLHNSVCQQF